jgi:hypothetical protein
MPEIAILTGDIINSKEDASARWIGILKPFFKQFGQSPGDWEIYRGDEFQLRLPQESALKAAIQIKALTKQLKNLDVRLGIGLGEESIRHRKIGESNGTAYQRSGKTFETLKQYDYSMRIATGRESYDRVLNLMLALALNFMDSWSQVSAEIMALVLAHPEAQQEELAQQLDIRQSAISQRLKRARKDLVLELLDYYAQTYKAPST